MQKVTHTFTINITTGVNTLTNTVVAVAVAATVFFSYNVIYAWTTPTATPPGGNVDAPLNTGSTAQDKNGDLGVNNLNVFKAENIQSGAPKIQFTDTNPSNSFLARFLYGTSTLFFQVDRNGDGKFDSPPPLKMYADANSNNDYLQVANQVRANQYCDKNGNCFTATDVTGGGSAPFIHLNTITAETNDNIMTADTDCKNAGYGGVWATEDRSGTEKIICYTSNISGIDTPVPLKCTVKLTSVMSTNGTDVTTIQMPENQTAAIGAYIGTGSNPPKSPYTNIAKKNYNSGNWNAQRYDQSFYYTTSQYPSAQPLTADTSSGYYPVYKTFTVKPNTSYSVKHNSIDGASGTVTVTADISTCQ